MVLDAQRGIVQNPEPAAALELLLLNLALLPQLLPLERMDSVPAPSAPVQGHPAHDRQEGSPLPARESGPCRTCPGPGYRAVNTGPRRKRAPLPAAANPLPSLRPPGSPEVAPGPSGKCPRDRQPVPRG